MALDPLPSGIVTPLVTFLTASGAPDPAATAQLVDYQLSNGVHGLLAVGSCGELGNLTPEQRVQTIELIADATAGRAPVWAGVAGLGTTEAVAAAKRAAAAGADALLVLPPMFFDSSDSEFERHYSLIADAVDIPIVAYDVPQRAPRKLPTPVIASLAQQGVVRGVKDSSGDLTAGRLTIEATEGIDGFQTYIGSEITMDAAFVLGFWGMVPGLANILPRPAVKLFEAQSRGDTGAVATAQRRFLDLFEILRVALAGAGGPATASNAIKIGTARVLGLPLSAVSEPMTQATPEFAETITRIVDTLNAADLADAGA